MMCDKSRCFADALWTMLQCRCESCDKIDFLDHLENLLDRNTLAWAEVAAAEASELGWKYIDGKVLCPDCALKRSSHQARGRD